MDLEINLKGQLEIRTGTKTETFGVNCFLKQHPEVAKVVVVKNRYDCKEDVDLSGVQEDAPPMGDTAPEPESIIPETTVTPVGPESTEALDRENIKSQLKLYAVNFNNRAKTETLARLLEETVAKQKRAAVGASQPPAAEPTPTPPPAATPPPAEPTPTPPPAATTPEEMSHAELQNLFKKYIAIHGPEKAPTILGEFNAKKLSDLQGQSRQNFIKKLYEQIKAN